MACGLFGGSARGDAASLMVLRPLAAIAACAGALCLTASDIKDNRPLLIFCAFVVGLPLLQLLPLPPEIWTKLPGRDLIVQIDSAAQLEPRWRPLTLAPEATWNAFYASLVFPAVILPGIHMYERHRQMLLPVLLVLGTASVLLGLLQVAGPRDSLLYLYRVTNNGAQVGMFANRNHHALLVALMIPMSGLLAARLIRGAPSERLIGLALIAGSIALLPVLLLIGSRGGLLAGAAAIAALPLLVEAGPFRPTGAITARFGELRRLGPSAGGFALMLVCGAVVVLSVSWGQGLALDRLLSQTIGEDLRWRMLPTVLAMVARYWPIGSGFGTFEKAFKVSEPDALLGPEYVNHAHNDWLELLVTGGVFGLVVLIIAAIALVVRARRAWAAPRQRGAAGYLLRLGYVLIGMIALASVGDYPLRAPAMTALFAVAVLWASCPFALTRPLTEPEKT